MGRSLRSLVAGLALATLFAPAGQAAQKPKPKGAAPPGEVEQLADIRMTLTFPAAIEGLEAEKATEHMRSRWKAKLGASSLDVRLYLLPIEEFGYEEPEDVTEGLLDSFREQSDPTFAYQGTELVSGAYGFAPYGPVGWGGGHRT